MEFVSAIAQRYSIHRYGPEPVAADLVHEVVQAGIESVALDPEIAVRWHIAWEGAQVTRALRGQIGISRVLNAPHYVIALSEERPGYMENLGFRMEQLILTATRAGLGTCWIGRALDEASVRPLVPDITAGEHIVALTPLGYADGSQTAQIVEGILRWGTNGVEEQKPLPEIASHYIWTVPWTGGDGDMTRVLEQVQRAPSWSDTQPWHFVVDERWVIATVDHRPQRSNVREGKADYRLDGGIAMCHFYLAARARGWQGTWMVPEEAEIKMLRDRYAIPETHDVLGIYPIQRTEASA
jgi:nitroreductase